MTAIIDTIHEVLGTDIQHLAVRHLIVRSLFVYVLGIFLGRLNKKFIARRTVTNFFLFIFLGSLLATAITGPMFYEILVTVIFIVIFNWIVGFLGYHMHKFRNFLEGESFEIVSNGCIQKENMRTCLVTPEELLSELRLQTRSSDLSIVEKAYFESSGQITFIIKK